MNKLVVVSAILAILVIILAFETAPTQAQSAFQSSRPATVFEPTLSFMRQNLRLMNSYVALFRSIFVGAYERPLVTSTDPPPSVNRVQPPKVPGMDLPASQQSHH